jgi:NADH:ubiquinone oxidoreductase subunit 5 (subunit L)/multisubunit Na+/H+ antiporter MnhA subunit
MEGPTPVSALIHAATMVTAGIYFMLRFSIIFELTENIQNFIALIGAFTAFFGASVAAFQYDVKKIIAYSTCSQLGYMICVCGFGGYKFAFYHLITHGYFKALLFFSAGVLIHNFQGEQDIRKMGGLCNLMPLTFSFFIVGLSCLMGLPGTSGFDSKEKILDYVSIHSSSVGVVSYFLLLFAMSFTVFYSCKLIYYIFFQIPNGS